MQYYVGEGDDRHLVDHPPLFACKCEGRKTLLTLDGTFIEELLATSQDIMPGNPGEIAGSYFRPAQPTFTLPDFLIPPKIFLYNPNHLRAAEALPYLIVLIDKKFFGIPARYLTPDRFAGCDELKDMDYEEPQPRAQPVARTPASGTRPTPRGGTPHPSTGARRPPRGKRPPGSSSESGRRPAPAPKPGSGKRRPPRLDESGVRPPRKDESGVRPPRKEDGGRPPRKDESRRKPRPPGNRPPRPR